MTELLIVTGWILFGVSTIGLMHEAGQRGHNTLSFLIPLASLGQVQRDWEVYRWWALGRVAGVLLAGAGGVLIFQTGLTDIGLKASDIRATGTVLKGSKSRRATSFVSSERAGLLTSQAEDGPLSGRLHDQAFQFGRATLIDGILTISQGQGFLSDLEVRILLDWSAEEITERRELRVHPAESEVPEIHLSWLPDQGKYPETRIFEEGYQLKLTLAPLDRYQLSGNISLVLPDSFHSYLAGDFTAHTTQLRYLDGEVDLTYDHGDTLAYVAEQYLQTQFPDQVLQRVDVKHVKMSPAKDSGTVLTRVYLSNGAVEEREIGLTRSDIGWAVAPGSMETRTVKAPDGNAVRLLPPVQTSSKPAGDSSGPVQIMKRFSELKAYVGQAVRLTNSDGQAFDGLLRQVTTDQLRMDIRMGGGRIERGFRREAVRSLRLTDGTVIRLQSSGQSAEPISASSASTPTNTDSASPYHGLIGKRVDVRLGDGRVQRGILKSVDEQQVTLSVSIQGGTMEHFYRLNDVMAIEAVQ